MVSWDEKRNYRTDAQSHPSCVSNIELAASWIVAYGEAERGSAARVRGDHYDTHPSACVGVSARWGTQLG